MSYILCPQTIFKQITELGQPLPYWPHPSESPTHFQILSSTSVFSSYGISRLSDLRFLFTVCEFLFPENTSWAFQVEILGWFEEMLVSIVYVSYSDLLQYIFITHCVWLWSNYIWDPKYKRQRTLLIWATIRISIGETKMILEKFSVDKYKWINKNRLYWFMFLKWMHQSYIYSANSPQSWPGKKIKWSKKEHLTINAQ